MFKKINIKMVVITLILYGTIGNNILFCEEIPTIEFIKASLKNQENLSYPSLKIKYVVGNLGREGKSETQFLYIRTPDYFFLESIDSKGNIGRAIYERNTGYERGIWITKNGNKFGKIDVGVGPFLGITKPETTYFPVLLKKFYFLIDSLEKGRVVNERKIIDGHRSWLIEITEEEVLYKIWLGEDIEFCPVLIESFTNNKNDDYMKFYKYKEVTKNFWFPMEIISGSPSSKWETYFRVTEISVGKPVPSEETKIEFPSGTVVTDFTTGTTFTVPGK